MRGQVGSFGVEVLGVGVKDVILPGEMKDVLNSMVQAEKAARANVIRRREEANATRSLLNTAKLIEEGPVLMRLKELEAFKVAREDRQAHRVQRPGQHAEAVGDVEVMQNRPFPACGGRLGWGRTESLSGCWRRTAAFNTHGDGLPMSSACPSQPSPLTGRGLFFKEGHHEHQLRDCCMPKAAPRRSRAGCVACHWKTRPTRSSQRRRTSLRAPWVAVMPDVHLAGARPSAR